MPLRKSLRDLMSIGLVIVSVSALAGCRGGNGVNRPLPGGPVSGEEFTLRVGQSTVVVDLRVEVGFDRVTDDSRCPSDVVCGWAGAAGLRLWLRPLSGDRENFQLTMPGLTARANESTVVSGYRVNLFELAPYPRSDIPIPPSAHHARLSVDERQLSRMHPAMHSRAYPASLPSVAN